MSMKILWIFFWGHHIFGLLKFQIFFGVLEVPDTFLGRAVDAGSEPTYTEKN